MGWCAKWGQDDDFPASQGCVHDTTDKEQYMYCYFSIVFIYLYLVIHCVSVSLELFVYVMSVCVPNRPIWLKWHSADRRPGPIFHQTTLLVCAGHFREFFFLDEICTPEEQLFPVLIYDCGNQCLLCFRTEIVSLTTAEWFLKAIL